MVVFAFQMFIDMHRELGSEVRRGHRELIEVQTKVRADLEAFVDFRSSHSGRLGNLWYSRTKDEMIGFLNDKKLPDALSKVNISWVLKSDNDCCNYLQNQPTTCGSILQSIFAKFHLLGVESAAYQQQVMFFCHIYNAGLQNRLLKTGTRSVDLDYLIQQQGCQISMLETVQPA